MSGALVMTVRWQKFVRQWAWRVQYGRRTRTGFNRDKEAAVDAAVKELQTMQRESKEQK